MPLVRWLKSLFRRRVRVYWVERRILAGATRDAKGKPINPPLIRHVAAAMTAKLDPVTGQLHNVRELPPPRTGRGNPPPRP